MSTSVVWPVIGGTTYSVPAAGEVNWASLSNFLIALGNAAQGTTNQKFAQRVATTTPITVSASSDCVVASQLASPGAVAVSLPAGNAGQVFCIIDATGDANSNNITITPNGAETIGGAATLVLNHAKEAVIICYNATTTDWKIMSRSITTITSADIVGVINPDKGGTGVANNNAATLTRSGNHALTLTTSNTTSLTLPTTGTLATLAGSETLTNKNLASSTNTLTGATAGSFTNTGTVTLFTASDTVVGRATTDTLTNKNLASSTNTLTGATAASFTNSGTVTLFTSSDTVVGRATTDTLTNKTLTAPVQSSYEDFTEIATPATPSAGIVRLYSKSGDNLYYKNSGGTEKQIADTSSSLTNPMTDVGDMIYGGTAGAATRLAGNTTTGTYFLTQVGTGSASQAPTWNALAYSTNTGTLSGANTSPTITVKYLVFGSLLMGFVANFASVTKNGSGTLGVSNLLPSGARPTLSQAFMVNFNKNGTFLSVFCSFNTSGDLLITGDNGANNIGNGDTMTPNGNMMFMLSLT